MAVTQIHFRFGVNSGTEADHGWHAAEDTNPTAGDGQTLAFATTFLLRCGVVATSNTNNYQYTWAYQKNGGTWVDITTTSLGVKCVDGILTNGADCTQRLTAGGAGSFVTNNDGCTEDGTGGGANNDIADTNFSESEIPLQLIAADLANGDVLTFRCGTATLTATPTLTIVKAATPKTATPPAEALGSGSDATAPTIDLRGILRPAPDADPWGTLADTAPTIDLAVATAPKTAAPDADALGSYADAPPTILRGELKTAAPTADPLGSYADVHEVTLGRAKGWDDSVGYLETAALIAQPAADPLGSYADADPTVDERGILLADIPADAWGTLDDAAPTIDLQEVPATPLTADCPADAWGTLADTDPTILETGALVADCPADPWANLADADPTILETGALVAAPDADAWGDLADTTPTVDRQELGNTPLTADCPADAWETLEDAAPTIDERGALAVEVPADAWETLADTAPTVDRQEVGITPLTADLPADAFPSYVDVGDPHLGRARGWEDALAYTETGALVFASAEDPLGSYADAAPTIDRQELGTTPLTADCPADSLGTYADAAPAVVMTGDLVAQPAADALSYADAAPTVDERGSLTVAVPADEWGTLADTAPTVDRQELGSDLTAQITDAKEAFADSVTVEGVTTPLTASPTDACEAYGDSVLPWLLEAEVLYADGVTYTYGKDYPFEADPWGTLADALTVERGQNPDLQVQATDSMAISDTIVALFAQAVGLPTDAWETLADAVDAGSPLSANVTDPNEAYTDALTRLEGLLYRESDDHDAYADALAGFLPYQASSGPDALAAYADLLAALLAYRAAPSSATLAAWADALAVFAPGLTQAWGKRYFRVLGETRQVYVPAQRRTVRVPTAETSSRTDAIEKE